ncbi:Uncharacterized protein Fot_20617 [Forsythia ovata]|uniref:Uncharacterized protein n=1 Tax=Forsythia ovata TaxID=205694 RepID=A0ABD1USJ7_9LAMI
MITTSVFGIMNLIECWFGATLCCHGAGGLTGQYKFGGMSGGCVALLGVAKLVLRLVLGSSLGFPEWRTQPETLRMHFEVLAKVDGDKVVLNRVVQINPVIAEHTVAPNVLMENTTMSKTLIERFE